MEHPGNYRQQQTPDEHTPVYTPAGKTEAQIGRLLKYGAPAVGGVILARKAGFSAGLGALAAIAVAFAVYDAMGLVKRA